MSNGLQRLGSWTFRHKWLTLSSWIVILVILGLGAVKFYAPPSDAISIPGTQAQNSLDRFAELFPDAGKGSGQLVFETKNGETIQSQRTEIAKLTDNVVDIEGVSQVVSPFMVPSAISEDGTIAYAAISFDQEMGSIDSTTIDALFTETATAQSDNLMIAMSGDMIEQAPGDILGVGEIVGVAIAFIVLIVTLGSLVAAGLPLLVAGVTVVAGAAGLFALSQVVDITSTTPVLAIMLGLAVGIDYSLFIVNKYRYFLFQGYTNEQAAARANATAGNAVVFAAITVVIALASLVVVGIPFISSMGLAAAATVALAAVVAITLLPALFGIVGARIFTGKTKRKIARAQARGPHESHEIKHSTMWYKLAQLITKRPVVSIMIGLIIVAGLAWPVRSLTLGLPLDQYAAKDTTQYQAYETLTRGFGEGFTAPLLIVVENAPQVTDEQKAGVAAELTAAYERQVAAQTAQQQADIQQQLARASSPDEYAAVQQKIAAMQKESGAAQAAAQATLTQTIAQYSQLYQLQAIADTITEREDVIEATPLLATEDTTKGIIRVIPAKGAADESTKQLIEELRDPSVIAGLTRNETTTFGVTGSTALTMDIDNKLAAALVQYLAIVIGLSFILLMLVFRSVLIPLKATLGFVLSVLAMFGAMVMVFQWGWLGIADAPGPIMSFVPIIAIGVLFGLAMDYEFFLVSSMHEEYERTKKAQRAVVDGYAIGSRVVVAAAVIMIAVFAGFITNHDATVQTIGFGLAIGILIDAFIVRLLIVPAVMKLFGRAAWWLPSWLSKLLPRISIEGDVKDQK